jgi:two-component system sensor histidine kinase/response regulator
VTAPVALLLVDDVPENLVALTALLRRDDVVLHTARSGPEALEILLVEDIGLALLDVQMPEMDGFELAELMRGAERTRHVPIIFVTANQDEPHRAFQGYDAGAVDYLIKPLDPVILRHKVDVFVELHRHRRELRHQLVEVERVSRELADTLRFTETFVAAVGHDLRSPLSAIMTGVDVLEHELPQGSRTLHHIRSSARRMTGILDQLYEVARARLGDGMELAPRPADLVAIVGDVVREARMSRPDRVIETTSRGDTEGVWDVTQLARVASNLISNALTHGKADAPIRVSLDGDRADVVTVEVWNAGAIPADLQPRIFQPFARNQRSSRGLGLGLYIVQQIVAAHGGQLGFESAEHVGTTFRFTLPRTAPSPIAAPAP